ncbi:dolichol-P-glucose synthetase [Haloarcula marismortui ATCC 43049]|uniref:Dolichol-P-glucose synthetase n=1 Tax=Haloarcula marismortui (strain ATCC 43049 / DSM 3752 / JCM 8966 / VKM B-1809) TaxID=272569 RepID=Q5V148_HALMA|nr:flippase-like domain-containing protein [Haloarcula marismortui]AAV46755.1 dolichol-P-glucose synthetase [Haloarcula marismortui ATCC 43049]QCP91463.1 flippase-like domain-containing protein [Haloarcula marismortui ATCC 43049]
MTAVKVSVVLPAYNEADTIEQTVSITLETLASFLSEDAYEVIVAEDGCSDRTPEIAARLANEDSRIRHVHSDDRLGRGGALEYAFDQADGDTLVYFDTDLATDMSHLEELVNAVRVDGYDVATGSRWLPENRADRPAKRGIPSFGYNTLVRTVLRSDLKDHQCGFKAFDRGALETLLPLVQDEHWFWDTELLVKAQRNGYRVKEFPVDWTPKGDSKVDIVRDVFGMGSQILRTFWELSVSPRITREVSLGAGTMLVVIALLLMTQYLDPDRVLAEMAGAAPEIVALSAVFYAVSWPLRGIRYRDILVSMGYRERWDFLTGAIFISQTGNLVFPARAGDAVRAYVIKARRSIPYPSGFASLAVERVFDLLTITLLAGVVMIGLAVTGSAEQLLTALTGDAVGGDAASSGRTAVAVAGGVGLAAIGAVVAIVASARSDRNLVRAGIGRLSSDSYADYVAGIIEGFVGDVQTVAADGSAFTRVGIGSLLIWTFDVITALIVFAAFGYSLTPSLVAVGFFAVSVGNLAKVLPLTPGGVGLYEGAFTVIVASLTPVGVAAAIGVAIVDHAVKNIVTIIGGVASMGWLNVSLTTAVEESQSTDAIEPETND